jgi:hypothetical protein
MFIGFTLLLHRPIIGCDPKLSVLKTATLPPVLFPALSYPAPFTRL